MPPVEPPTAGFILQLFFIPLMIVGIIVLIWLLFSWLAHMGTDPHQYVKDLQTPGKANWQAASSLAEELKSRQNVALKRDPKLAADLSEALAAQIKAGHTDNDAIRLQMFLCRALGEFEVPDVLPVLLVAAKTERDPAEMDVRRSALEAIAVLANHVGPDVVLENDQTLPTLVLAAGERGDSIEEDEKRSQLRERAAFALGVIGGTEALQLLDTMQSDAVANVRYNAATGLARHGDERAERVLLQMLDPTSENVIAGEKQDSGKVWKRASVIMNGLASVEQLAERNPNADLGPLLAAIEKLTSAELPAAISQGVKLRAKEVRSRIAQQRPAPSGS